MVASAMDRASQAVSRQLSAISQTRDKGLKPFVRFLAQILLKADG
jgi:hypothetical protein